MQRKGLHLQFGIGTPHAVTIDERQAACCGDNERRGRIDAACLAAEHRVDLSPQHFLELTESIHQFVALGQLFGHDGWSAHHADGHDQRVVRQFVDIDKLDRAMLADRLLRHQLADIGIAAATCAENSAADRDVFEIFGMDRSQRLHHSPYRAISRVTSGSNVSSGKPKAFGPTISSARGVFIKSCTGRPMTATRWP